MNGVTLPSFLTDQLADTETAWSIGTFGAIAEFTRGAHEEATFTGSDSVISVVTVRGGLRIEACRDPRPIASESPTAESWSHRVALCLPKDVCAMSRRTVLTELGPDETRCARQIEIASSSISASERYRSTPACDAPNRPSPWRCESGRVNHCSLPATTLWR